MGTTRKGDTLSNVLDQYTGENLTYKKVTNFIDGTTMSDALADGIIYIKSPTAEYFKRVFDVLTPEMFGAKGDGISDDYLSLNDSVLIASKLGTQISFNPESTYLLNSDINITESVNLDFSGAKLNGKGFSIAGLSIGASGLDNYTINTIDFVKDVTLSVEFFDNVSVSGSASVYVDFYSTINNTNSVSFNNFKAPLGGKFVNLNINPVGSFKLYSETLAIPVNYHLENVLFSKNDTEIDTEKEMFFGDFNSSYSENRALFSIKNSKFVNTGLRVGDSAIHLENCEFIAGNNNNGNHEQLHIVTAPGNNLPHRILNCTFDGNNTTTDFIDLYAATNVVISGCLFKNHRNLTQEAITIKSHTGSLYNSDYENIGNRDGIIFENNTFEDCERLFIQVFSQYRTGTEDNTQPVTPDALKANIIIRNNTVNFRQPNNTMSYFVNMRDVSGVIVENNIIRMYTRVNFTLVNFSAFGTPIKQASNIIIKNNIIDPVQSVIDLITTISSVKMFYGSGTTQVLKNCIISGNIMPKGALYEYSGNSSNVIVVDNIVSLDGWVIHPNTVTKPEVVFNNLKNGTTVDSIVNGGATFSGPVSVGNPTDTGHAINKTYFDANAIRKTGNDTKTGRLRIEPDSDISSFSARGLLALTAVAYDAILPTTGTQKVFSAVIDQMSLAFFQLGYNIGGTGKPGFEFGDGTGARELKIYRSSLGLLAIEGGILIKSLFGSISGAKVSDYTTTISDYTIPVNATTGNRVINLHASTLAVSGASAQVLIIKKIDSSTNVVTIDANGSELIDSTLTFVLRDQDESVSIQCTGAGWKVIGYYNPNVAQNVTKTASGNGVLTSISIPHGLSYTPIITGYVANNAISSTIEWMGADATHFIAHFNIPPEDGVNNLSYNISHKK